MIRDISELLKLIENDSNLIESASSCFNQKKHLNISGMCEQEKGYFTAALSNRFARKPVIIVSDYVRARSLSQSLAPFVDGSVFVLQPSELSLVSAIASSRGNELERTGVINRLLNNDFGAVIICAGALMNKMTPVKEYTNQIIKLRLGESLDLGEFTAKLTYMGYERTGMATAPGEFSWRGDVIDIFPSDSNLPIRLNFFDDEVDQIKTFDPETQRSVDSVKKIVISPVQEILIPKKKRGDLAKKVQLAAAEDINKMNSSGQKTVAELLYRMSLADSDSIREGIRVTGMARWLDVVLENYATILDYVDRTRCMIFIDELAEIKARLDSYVAEFYSRCKAGLEIGNAPSCAANSIINTPETMKTIDKVSDMVAISCLASSGNGLPGGMTINTIGAAGDNWRGRDKELADLIKNVPEGKRVVLMISGKQRTEAFKQRMWDLSANPTIIDSNFPSGFINHKIGLMIIGEHDLFGSEKMISNKKSKSKNGFNFFEEIKPGDYVVHDVHGIGRYEGIVNLRRENSVQDFFKICYAKNAVIYLPVDKLDKLQKYLGPNNKEPKLSSLDSQDWNKSVSRARSAIKKVAYDLVKLYALRRTNKGFACLPDDQYQQEFEESFPYMETEDQLLAIRDIKRDMETDIPMDRLLCGDVGFGKTEVAFRAMFKCVSNGKQAFMMAPTTLLAQQHYDNFVERLNGFPINVVLLSRYVPTAQLKKNLKDIKEGKADVVIGTHRILSDDVCPPSLGLLVVDEEQRFGVNHKEKIKAMRNNIDVLTLTATPIPRTLHMSMAGIRDISVLNEAPINRRSVQTYVMGYDEEIIIQACMREVSRGGQIFYLHNKTSDIDEVASHLSQIMPGMRVLYAHGKMSEHQMEKIVESFVRGEADILVCTTIIESGVDMPNVNTIIVENSDRFGLAQLYQIRGRVGRSEKQAYAYITYNEDGNINSDARKRLMAIREFTELGSGVKIALRDLEVRGAGNLLGAEQHGQMDAIGYELYCRIMDEEIKRLREGDADEVNVQTETASIEVDFDSYIPSSYIDDEMTRMSIYRRISLISSRKEYDDFLDEIIDRYGEPPREVMFLAGASLIRAMATSSGFTRVCFKGPAVLAYFAENRKVDMKALSKLIGHPDFSGRVMINIIGKAYIHYKPRTANHAATVTEVMKMFDVLSEVE